MKRADANRQIRQWRDDAREKYSISEIAKKVGCSESVLTHKATLYRLPFYQAMKLKELSEK